MEKTESLEDIQHSKPILLSLATSGILAVSTVQGYADYETFNILASLSMASGLESLAFLAEMNSDRYKFKISELKHPNRIPVCGAVIGSVLYTSGIYAGRGLNILNDFLSQYIN